MADGCTGTKSVKGPALTSISPGCCDNPRGNPANCGASPSTSAGGNPSAFPKARTTPRAR